MKRAAAAAISLMTVLSGNDVSDDAGIWRLADRTWTDGAGRSGDVCALYWHFYQSDPDSGRAGRNDAKGSFRLPPFP